MLRKMLNTTLLFSILMYEASKAVPDNGIGYTVPTAMRSYGGGNRGGGGRGNSGGKCQDDGKWCYQYGHYCGIPDMKKLCPKTCNFCDSSVVKEPKFELSASITTTDACSNHDCEHNCEIIDDQKSCTCKSGYVLNTEDRRSCQDIDECEEDEGSCATNFDAIYCKNTPGSFECVKDPPPCGVGKENYYESDKCCKTTETSECGLNRVNTGGFGTPGLDSVLDQWPWSVLVMIGKRPCTGTLISEEHVLVPAHCFSGWRDDVAVKVYLGMRSSDQKSFKHYTQTINVSPRNINIHEQYDYPNNDIAVIQMDNAAKSSSYVRPICLPNGEIPDVGGKCYISGYQSEVQSYGVKLTLEESSLIVSDIDLCKKKNPGYASKMKDNDFICGTYADDRNVCPGERGGPLVCQRCSSCGWYLAGMASLGDACADVANGKLIFTTIEKYESWVAQITGINVNKNSVCNNAPKREEKDEDASQSWGQWSVCSVTCGGGSRRREKQCNGTSCPGQEADIQPCGTNKCPTWSDYTDWSQCSKSCDGGEKARTRNCLYGEVGDAGCSGPTMEKRSCNEEPCPYWLEWSDWSDCPATCGVNVIRYRSRECSDGSEDGSNCFGQSRQKENCELPTCSKWGPWAEWTACSKSCSGGTRSTSRVCLTQNTAPCKGRSEMTKSCNAFACPEFGEKSSDSECEGTRNNFADAWCEDNQARGNWCQKFKKWMGDSCAKTCCYVRSQENKKETPEKTSEGPKWSEWSECSITCGSNGVQTRKKVCKRNKNRAACKQIEERDCSSDVECWLSWSSWSTCSASCGYGLTVRSRDCPDDSCVGDFDEKKSCFIDYCPSLYSDWSSWSECSKTCGGGEKTRTRSCLNTDNAECKEDATEKEKCNEKQCLVLKLPLFSPIVSTSSEPSCNPAELRDSYSTGYCRNRLERCAETDQSYFGQQVKNVCEKTCCQQKRALSECTDHPLWADECPLLQSYCFMFGLKDNKAHQGCKKTCQLC